MTKYGGKLGTHLTPWRVLNVTPSLTSAPFCPRVWHWEGSVMHHVWTGSGLFQERWNFVLHPKAQWDNTHSVPYCGIINVNCLICRHTSSQHTLAWPHLSLLPFWVSLCLRSHSPCPSYIPKEAITSLARASPWAVVIVTSRLVDMTTPTMVQR